MGGSAGGKPLCPGRCMHAAPARPCAPPLGALLALLAGRFLLGAVVALGLFSGIAFSAAYQLVARFANKNVIGGLGTAAPAHPPALCLLSLCLPYIACILAAPAWPVRVALLVCCVCLRACSHCRRISWAPCVQRWALAARRRGPWCSPCSWYWRWDQFQLDISK